MGHLDLVDRLALRGLRVNPAFQGLPGQQVSSDR